MKKIIISFNSLLLEVLLYSWVFYFFYSVTFNPHYYQENLFIYLGIQLLFWFLIAIFTHKFKKFTYKNNYFKSLFPFVNSYILFFLITISIQYLFSFQPYVVKKIYFSTTIYILWSFTVQSFRYFSFKPQKTDEINLSFLKATTYLEIEELTNGNGNSVELNIETDKFYSTELRKKLKTTYLSDCPSLYKFISSSINLNKYDVNKLTVLRSSDPYNVSVLESNSVEIFINLHKLNDIRRINEYFINLNKKLINGGIYISKLEPTRFRYRRHLKKYPNILAQIIYFHDFIWRRVIPKLPVVKKTYFAVTKGKNRAISLAEGLGRLYYSGFEVLNLHEEENFITFIARKVKSPSTDQNPSYGPLFKMRRVGKNGDYIFVYKFRTMHPYSEYLQKFVFDRNSLEEGGKIKNDFRITYWGAIFRKLWIDELPMFINFFKGEMKLIGIRPLSKHYFGLYPQELQEARVKTKPGLIPPFYVDMPKTMEEIVASEMKYLKQYEKAPFKTDIKYFFKAFNNIIFKKARSA